MSGNFIFSFARYSIGLRNHRQDFLCGKGKTKVEKSQLFGFFRQFSKISGKKSPILSTESTESTDKKVPGTRDRVMSPVLSVIPKPNRTLVLILLMFSSNKCRLFFDILPKTQSQSFPETHWLYQWNSVKITKTQFKIMQNSIFGCFL